MNIDLKKRKEDKKKKKYPKPSMSLLCVIKLLPSKVKFMGWKI